MEAKPAKEFEAKMGNPDEFVRRVVREPVGLSVTGRVDDATHDKRHPITIPIVVISLAGVARRFAERRLHAPRQRRPAPAAPRTPTAQLATDQAVLRRLPQRSRQDRRRQLRRHHAGEHRPACRPVREGRAQAARPRHAAAGREAAGCAGRRFAGRVARDSLDKADGQAHIPDQVVLHRLNRKEYANAVRDLLAVEFDATELLPEDDIADGFDNIASALQVSPSFIEQYVIAARTVAVKALGRPDARPGGWTFRAGPGTQLTHVAGPAARHARRHSRESRSPVGRRIPSSTSPTWPPTSGAMAWSIENPLVVTLDNKIVYETVIGGEEDMKLYDQVQNGALDRVNARLKNIRFSATAGPHKIGVTFKRQSFAESDDELQVFSPGGGQDRLYRVNSFQLLGPFNAKGLSSTPSRERIFICHPARTSRDARSLRQEDHRVAGEARLSPSGDRPRT